MSLQRFGEELTRAMRMLGRTVTCTQSYSYGSANLTPQDGSEQISVEYEIGPNRDKGEIRFLGSIFRLDSRSNKYRIDRAVGLLLTEETRVLQERKKEVERDKIRKEYRKRSDWAKSLNENLKDTNLSVGVPYEHTWTYYEVNFRSEDQAEIMAIIDYLRDGGFVTQVTKKEGDE